MEGKLSRHLQSAGSRGVGWIAYTSNPWPNATKGFLPVGDANFGVVF